MQGSPPDLDRLPGDPGGHSLTAAVAALRLPALPRPSSPADSESHDLRLGAWRGQPRVHAGHAAAWEQFIDWMALAGHNSIVAPTGQEEVQYRILTEQFGLEDMEVRNWTNGQSKRGTPAYHRESARGR